MSSTSAPSEQPESIDLTKLPLEQLLQIKHDFDQETTNIQDSLQTLYNCKAKYATSKEALDSFQPDWDNREILVPLTSSMYVPGCIKDIDSFIIDIGTGYYVEKDLETSKDYFKRRVDYVQEQIEKIEKIQLEKTRFANSVNSLIELKQDQWLKQLQSQHQQQQQQEKTQSS